MYYTFEFAQTRRKNKLNTIVYEIKKKTPTCGFTFKIFNWRYTLHYIILLSNDVTRHRVACVTTLKTAMLIYIGWRARPDLDPVPA